MLIDSILGFAYKYMQRICSRSQSNIDVNRRNGGVEPVKNAMGTPIGADYLVSDIIQSLDLIFLPDLLAS